LVDSRDDFSIKTKELLAKRVGYHCSNPSCYQLTSGPHKDMTRTVNVGVAAHITAASPGGPRYELALSVKQRKSAENGIWLCQKCAKLVDNDLTRYTDSVLKEWKQISEERAIHEIEGITLNSSNSSYLSTKRLEACEKLFYAVKNGASLIEELFEIDELTFEEKKEVVSQVILLIAELTDDESFYLDDELAVHAVGSFVGIEDVFVIKDHEARQIEINIFRKKTRNTYRMIKSIRDVGKLDRSIKSPLIDYYTQLKEAQDKDDEEY
jgi:hypothetical protein